MYVWDKGGMAAAIDSGMPKLMIEESAAKKQVGGTVVVVLLLIVIIIILFPLLLLGIHFIKVWQFKLLTAITDSRSSMWSSVCICVGFASVCED